MAQINLCTAAAITDYVTKPAHTVVLNWIGGYAAMKHGKDSSKTSCTLQILTSVPIEDEITSAGAKIKYVGKQKNRY